MTAFPPLSVDEELRLGLLIRMTGDREALNKLVRHNIRFAVMLARRYLIPQMELDDLIQQANLGLIEAAEKFEPARGYRFITYASWYIRLRIFEALGQRHIIRRPAYLGERVRAIVNATADEFNRTGHEPTVQELASLLGLTESQVVRAQAQVNKDIVSLDRRIIQDERRTVGDSVHDSSVIHPEIHLLARNEMNLLVRWFEKLKHIAQHELSASDQAIFFCRYGLDDDSFELRNFREIAEQTGVNPERPKQRIGAIIRLIRAVGVGTPLSEEVLEFEIQRLRGLQAALADCHIPRVE